MIRLKICSFLLVCLMLFGLVVAQDMFGEISDGSGGEIEAFDINEWGGSVYNVPISDADLEVKYDGESIKYNGLKGELTFSKYGKLVEGKFDVKDGGEYVLGNLKINLKAGAKVVFKDGELSITDPGKMYDKSDVDLIDDDLGWDETELKLSGDGVDFMGLKEVSVNEYGAFLQDPQGVKFDDFTLYGKGKVYFDTENKGEQNLDFPGAYISVNPEAGKFVIGSNAFGESISVMPNAENHYGLKFDVQSDYIAFKSIGGAEPSFLRVTDRTAEGLVPRVDTVGFFAIDNDGEAVYMGEGRKIYTVLQGNVLSEFGTSGATASPLEIHFSQMQDGEMVALSDYGGVVGIGNDGAMGYGYDASFLLGGKYGKAGGSRASQLNYGISNRLLYNYNLDKAALEKLFNLKIIDRSGFLNNPRNVRLIADTLSRFPKATKILNTLEFTGSGGISGMASGRWIGLYRPGQDVDTLAHELTHTFDFYTGGGFERDWDAIRGDGYPHTWNYGAKSSYEAKAVTGQFIFASDSYWKGQFAKQGGIKIAAKVAVLAKWGFIQDYDAARVLRNAGVNVNPANPTASYDTLIRRVAGV